MSVEGQEFPPVGSMKYFKICEGYELNFMVIADTHHHTCAKFAVFSLTLSQISHKTRGQ